MILRDLARVTSLIFLSVMFTDSPALASNFIDVQSFGAIKNDNTDDSGAIQAAIDSASLTGSTVYFSAGVYDVNTTLKIPAGVSLLGEGKGITSTGTPSGGSIIRNTGTTMTIRIEGSNVKLTDLVVYDTDNAGAMGGIHILADEKAVESVIVRNVLISGFTDGDALVLEAKNNGGLSYCSFYDIGIRYARSGIIIWEDQSSFVNSNTFYHGFMSGGECDYGIRVMGGNNNVFNSMIIEPQASNIGHIIVESGEITGNDIRLEGTHQAAGIPLIKFYEETYNSYMNGVYSGGLTIDQGDNFINFRNGKSLDEQNATTNLFVNSSFIGVENSAIPYWEISGAGVTVDTYDAEILPGNNVIRLTIPAGISGYLRPTPQFMPKIMAPAKYDNVNFGAYVKTSKPNLITTICKSPTGITTGTYHPGDNDWHVVGMTSGVSRTHSYDPKFYFSNTGPSQAFVYITVPTLNFGLATLEIEASPILASGGIMTGTLSTGMVRVDTHPSTFITLPKEGNVFEVDGTSSISRINHLTADRFPKGTVITLLFNDSNAIVLTGAYIQLKSSFASVQNGSITLISKGDGTWRELDRNN